jgi:LDH2 family malate/lactate/ureidoglycolate dehydrogenase
MIRRDPRHRDHRRQVGVGAARDVAGDARARDLAREHGLGAAVITNSYHIGRSRRTWSPSRGTG